MRAGNTELLRSFYVSLLGVASLIGAIVVTYDASDWRAAASRGLFSVIAAGICYLTMRHYRRVEEFKNRPYSLFLLGAGIALSVVALILQMVPPLRGH